MALHSRSPTDKISLVKMIGYTAIENEVCGSGCDYETAWSEVYDMFKREYNDDLLDIPVYQ